MRQFIVAGLLVTAASSAAFAQEDNGALVDRMNRLERDLNYVQRQVYRNGESGSADAGEISTAGPASGHQEVRLAQMDEQIRQMRGAVEQVQYSLRQVTLDLKRLSDDTDYRLRAIEQKQAEAATLAAAAAAPQPAAPVPAASATTPAAAPATTEPAAAAGAPAADTASANTEYSAAFKLINAKKYSEAATAFDAFVKKYPNDPLTSNAYYWLGESYYSRSDYTRAAESFRKGFEANPEAQKAPDNLLKLALSLGQVKRTSEACIVLSQIPAKYADTAPRTTKRAQAAYTDLQCK